MTDKEVMQQALEALERYQVKRQDFDRFADVITALRTALEQQAEPVATFQDGVLEGQLREREYWVKQQAEPVAWMDKHGNIDHGLDAILEPEGWKPLYTIPPAAQRQWVGLTDEDCKRMSAGDKLVAMWAEAKLKERNT